MATLCSTNWGQMALVNSDLVGSDLDSYPLLAAVSSQFCLPTCWVRNFGCFTLRGWWNPPTSYGCYFAMVSQGQWGQFTRKTSLRVVALWVYLPVSDKPQIDHRVGWKSLSWLPLWIIIVIIIIPTKKTIIIINIIIIVISTIIIIIYIYYPKEYESWYISYIMTSFTWYTRPVINVYTSLLTIAIEFLVIFPQPVTSRSPAAGGAVEASRLLATYVEFPWDDQEWLPSGND